MEATLEAYQILKGKKGFDIQNHALKTGKPVWFKTRIVTWGPWIQTGTLPLAAGPLRAVACL